MFRRWVETFHREVILSEGSTRPLALMRIGLALLAWSRWGNTFALFHVTPYRDFSTFLIGVSFYLSTTLMLLGFWSQFSCAWAGFSIGCIYYHLGFHRGYSLYASHHVYLLFMGVCLLTLTPCGRSLSLDRLLALKRQAQKGESFSISENGPLWGMTLLALQITMVYLWSAFDKTSPVFLSGDRIEAILMQHYFGSDYPAFPYFHIWIVLFSWGTVMLEYFLAFALWFKKTRGWAMGLGIFFHATLYYLLPVNTFSLTMILMYLAFLPPAEVCRWIDEMLPSPSKPQTSP